jgi:hypothetical protein
MDDQELRLRLDNIEKRLEAVYRSAEATRKYIFWTIVITVALFILPLVGLAFVIPSFIDTYTQALGGIGGL